MVIRDFPLDGEIDIILPKIRGYFPGFGHTEMMGRQQSVITPTERAGTGRKNQVIYRKIDGQYFEGGIQVTACCNDPDTSFIPG